MKRKTILSFITGLFLLGGLSSCMDLDETVYDKLPADDFGQSTAELDRVYAFVRMLRFYGCDSDSSRW